MLDGSNNSELWLIRTYFDDDARWNAIEAAARKTRSRLPGASLVVSADQSQCHQRIRRIMTHLATRAEANSQFYVAIADKQTFGHPDQLLLTVDCSPLPRTTTQLPLKRLAPQHAFLLGTTDRHSSAGHATDPIRSPTSRTNSVPNSPPPSNFDPSDLAALVSDAIQTSHLWKRALTRDVSRG